MKTCDERSDIEKAAETAAHAMTAEEAAAMAAERATEDLAGATRAIPCDEKEKLAVLLDKEANIAADAAQLAAREAEVALELTEISVQADHHEIDYFVEVDGAKRRGKLSRSPATGREIRAGAGVPESDDLARLVHGRPAGGNIGLNESVPVHCGEGFIAVPSGRVS